MIYVTSVVKKSILPHMIRLIKKMLPPQIFFFGIIGGTGFIIDTSVFTLLHDSLSYAGARCVSIGCAMLFTWFSNRTFTFKTNKKISHHEILKYAGSNLIGCAINLAIFLSLCHASVLLKEYYLVPLMLATSVSMVWNFTLAKYFVFR